MSPFCGSHISQRNRAISESEIGCAFNVFWLLQTNNLLFDQVVGLTPDSVAVSASIVRVPLL